MKIYSSCYNYSAIHIAVMVVVVYVVEMLWGWGGVCDGDVVLVVAVVEVDSVWWWL